MTGEDLLIDAFVSLVHQLQAVDSIVPECRFLLKLLTIRLAHEDCDVTPVLKSLGLDELAADVAWHDLVRTPRDRDLYDFFVTGTR